jgi:protein-S-isoprenylcysteine O-methyltransferase Ste14
MNRGNPKVKSQKLKVKKANCHYRQKDEAASFGGWHCTSLRNATAGRHLHICIFAYFHPVISLFFRNLFFTIIHPGLVAGLVPYWIIGKKTIRETFSSFRLHHYLAMVIFLAGLVILLSCIIRFAVEGRGTLSPDDPTKKLVIKGLYRYSRNPMYVGVMLMLIGESVLFNSPSLWAYALVVFILFNLFILLVEEPRLRKDFSTAYKDYCSQVRRWL